MTLERALGDMGSLEAPFGRLWGALGVIKATLGRHCGHFLREAAELSKTKEILGFP